MTLRLTKRQREVLLLRSRGMSTEDMAEALHISVYAVSQRFYEAMRANPGNTQFSLLAEFVREQCKEGVWE